MTQFVTNYNKEQFFSNIKNWMHYSAISRRFSGHLNFFIYLFILIFQNQSAAGNAIQPIKKEKLLLYFIVTFSHCHYCERGFSVDI